MGRAELYSGRKPKTDKNLQGWLAPSPNVRQAQTTATSAGISPRNVPFQLLDGLCLTGDDPADEVANRHHPHDLVVLDDGKMTKTLVRHNGHAFVHRVLRSNEDHRAGHDFPHQHLLRG